LVGSEPPFGRRIVTDEHETESHEHEPHETELIADRVIRLARELTEIRVALGGVAAFEGIHESSPTAMMVDELVRDHEELEARIDAVMIIIKAIGDGDRTPRAGYDGPDEAWRDEVREIGRILQGGPRVPDTPETL
jgi:hypothetical protein